MCNDQERLCLLYLCLSYVPSLSVVRTEENNAAVLHIEVGTAERRTSSAEFMHVQLLCKQPSSLLPIMPILNTYRRRSKESSLIHKDCACGAVNNDDMQRTRVMTWYSCDLSINSVLLSKYLVLQHSNIIDEFLQYWQICAPERVVYMKLADTENHTKHTD